MLCDAGGDSLLGHEYESESSSYKRSICMIKVLVVRAIEGVIDFIGERDVSVGRRYLVGKCIKSQPIIEAWSHDLQKCISHLQQGDDDEMGWMV